jgi:ABC-2 type transport system permease protein
MDRLIRAITAIALIAVITVSAITICQNIGKSVRVDITDQGLYTLSDGTRAILDGLNQPITLKLYYSRTAAMEGPDQIRYFNDYSVFVRALLDEYVAAAKGNIILEVIDPESFSDDEVDAIRHGLKRFSLPGEKNFFFGMVLKTPFGVEKKIDFFSPDREKFVEYDISYLIDTAITREKRRIGIISSLSMMGDTGYMAQMMRAQGKQPKPTWGIVRHLQQTYQVNQIATEVEEITDTDILLVIHPKDLPEKTQFAIDQYILKGGRAIICVDPHSVIDQPDPMQMQMMMQSGQMPSSNSSLDKLLGTWGLEMPPNTFAGDMSLAVTGSSRPNERPGKIIAILALDRNFESFNSERAMTAELNKVNVMFPGALKKTAGAAESGLEYTPLLMTTDRGNTWKVSSPYELMSPDYAALRAKFTEGTQPVVMAYRITGRFKSSFPDGVEVPDESDAKPTPDGVEEEQKTKTLTGLAEASADCDVVVFADVDFISDIVAYRNTFFGITVVEDNAALMLNAIEDLTGSSNLFSIRSRGNFKRPFTVVNDIERQAEEATAAEEANINAQIAGFQKELTDILSKSGGKEGAIIETAILNKKMEVESTIRDLQKKLRQVKMKKVQRIDKLGANLRNLCTLPGPAIIMLIAILLWVRRSVMKRHYISHASDS